MSPRSITLAATAALAVAALAPRAQSQPPRPSSVAEIKSQHDRELIRALDAYIQANPKAVDLEQAYMTLFDAVIEHDWFEEHQPIARRYLDGVAEGAVRPLAQVILTMAGARQGRPIDALSTFEAMLDGLPGVEQEEFAVDFADTLARELASAGEVAPARKVYELLLRKFGDNRELRDKVGDDLARLDRVGKPAPRVAVKDLDGKPIRLEDYRGKYVLVDFWATWCVPCVSELPRLRAAYATYKDRGFEILAISLDDTREAVVDFVRARKLPWRQVHNASSFGDPVDAFGVGSIPASFLIGPDGTVLRVDPRGKALDDLLAKLLGGAKPEAK